MLALPEGKAHLRSYGCSSSYCLYNGFVPRCVGILVLFFLRAIVHADSGSHCRHGRCALARVMAQPPNAHSVYMYTYIYTHTYICTFRVYVRLPTAGRSILCACRHVVLCFSFVTQ